jgi:hypothetical protein
MKKPPLPPAWAGRLTRAADPMTQAARSARMRGEMLFMAFTYKLRVSGMFPA